MKRTPQMRNLLLQSTSIALALLLMPLAGVAVFAAEAPPDVETIDMSVEVGTRLSEVTALMNERKLAEADAAMQGIRATLQEGMNDYERFRMLQLSGNLNTALQKYPEAIADYEAILQMPAVADAGRLNAASMAGQLYLQLGDWSKGLEHLLTVNELEGGKNQETLFRIAYSYAQAGQAATAIPYMEQALSLAGDNAAADYYRNMAVLYMQSKNPAKAIETYEKLLEIYPDIADRERVGTNIAALYIDLGNNAKARTLLQTLLREYPTSDQAPTWRQSLTALGGGRP